MPILVARAAARRMALGCALLDIAAAAGVQDGLRARLFLGVARGHDQARHAAKRRLAIVALVRMVVAPEHGMDGPPEPAGDGVVVADREIALHRPRLVVSRMQLHGMRRKTIGQQGRTGTFGIGEMVEDAYQGDAMAAVHGPAFKGGRLNLTGEP